jgi:hypothetical protein
MTPLASSGHSERMTTRRASLPGASELFRTTTAPTHDLPTAAAPGEGAPAGRERPASGRRRHDEKITVYCSADELVALERARLQLRADYGLAIDRGRMVREALAVVLADLEANGSKSELIRRLQAE